MADQEQFLRVNAIAPGRTYIGAEFCPGESELLAAYNVADPWVDVDIQLARQEVQAGAKVAETMSKYRLDITLNGGRSLGAPIRHCLGQIAAGNCQVYPR